MPARPGNPDGADGGRRAAGRAGAGAGVRGPADDAGIEAAPDAEGQLRYRLHAEARLAPAEPPADQVASDLAALRTRCRRAVDGQAHYGQLLARGADFGPAFQGVRQLWVGEDEALGEFEVLLPPMAGSRPHPATLDGCLQVAAGVLTENTSDTFVPVVLERFEGVATSWPQHLLVHARLAHPDRVRPQFDFTILDRAGTTLARFRGLQFHNKTTASADNALRTWIYTTEWRECAPAVRNSACSFLGKWLLLADQHGVADAMAEQIQRGGGTCVLAEPGSGELQINAARVKIDPRAPEQFRTLLDSAGERGFAAIVDFWPIEVNFDLDQLPTKALSNQAAGYGPALHLLQALIGRSPAPPVFLVTAAAAPVEDAVGTPVHAAISALRKTLHAEFPELVCRLIDLDDIADPRHAAAALASELEQSDEPDVALRQRRRLAPRLVAAPIAAAPKDQLVELVPSASALIEDLSFVTRGRRAPMAGEVEIEVRATGLNFRDLLNALGMLPDATPRLGGECAGIVSRVGSGARFAVGDPVLAFCPGQSGSVVTVPATHVVHKPAILSFAQAAGLPIAYMTALYALHRLAGLRAGQTILIHTAAGGLGSAATYLALARGARVYATAGSEAKREHLRALGATAVMSSRTVEFADHLLRETGGSGVDVVLNTLSGEFVPAGFKALASGGRFIEVGKRDVFTPAQASRHRPDAIFHRFDLGELAESDPTLVPALLGELIALIAGGAVPPLPVQSLPYGEAKRALHKMADAQHIGKLVLLHPCPGQAANSAIPAGAYLITGGFGALGLQAARWLADAGATTWCSSARVGGGQRSSPQSKLVGHGSLPRKRIAPTSTRCAKSYQT